MAYDGGVLQFNRPRTLLNFPEMHPIVEPQRKKKKVAVAKKKKIKNEGRYIYRKGISKGFDPEKPLSNQYRLARLDPEKVDSERVDSEKGTSQALKALAALAKNKKVASKTKKIKKIKKTKKHKGSKFPKIRSSMD